MLPSSTQCKTVPTKIRLSTVSDTLIKGISIIVASLSWWQLCVCVCVNATKAYFPHMAGEQMVIITENTALASLRRGVEECGGVTGCIIFS